MLHIIFLSHFYTSLYGRRLDIISSGKEIEQCTSGDRTCSWLGSTSEYGLCALSCFLLYCIYYNFVFFYLLIDWDEVACILNCLSGSFEVENDCEHFIFLPLLPEGWNYRCVLYVLLGIQNKVSYMLSRQGSSIDIFAMVWEVYVKSCMSGEQERMWELANCCWNYIRRKVYKLRWSYITDVNY